MLPHKDKICNKGYFKILIYCLRKLLELAVNQKRINPLKDDYQQSILLQIEVSKYSSPLYSFFLLYQEIGRIDPTTRVIPIKSNCSFISRGKPANNGSKC